MGKPDKLVATAAYQPEPAAAAAARRFVRDTLETWVTAAGDADGHGLVDDAVLLTSELVTNAVVHAGTQVHVTCTLANGGVEVAVRDSQPASLVPEPPAIGYVPAERTSGRGLLLPAALASAWGVTYGRTAKAVWFRIGLGVPGTPPDDPVAGADDGPGILAAAVQAAAAEQGRLSTAVTADSAAGRLPSDPGYGELLRRTAESARAAAGADAACIMLADEDGELRLCGAAGTVPAGQAPSALTVPFLVEGRVTGLLSVTAAAAGALRDGAATALLAELADRAGPALERARRADLDRLRRERISALAAARELLSGGLGQDKIMAIAGEAVVPRLAGWCAVLLADDGTFRTAYSRHADESRSAAVAWLLDRACDGAHVTGPPPQGQLPSAGGQPRPAWRWPLSGPAGRTGAPPGAASLAADAAWCFPFAVPAGLPGLLAVGSGYRRLPRDVAALAADLAGRIGVALGGPAASRGGNASPRSARATRSTARAVAASLRPSSR